MATTLKEIIYEAEKSRNEIIKIILSLPGNPEVKPISESPRTFQITISDVIKNDMNLSADYYCFEKQYEMIAEIIRFSQLEKIESNLQKIISKGSIIYRGNRFRLNKEVIKNLKIAIYGKD